MARGNQFDFSALVRAIQKVDTFCLQQASRAINISLTLRNWSIGYYIREFEQSGSDRAAYGENLLERLCENLQGQGLKRCDVRELRRYRQFYVVYSQIRETLTPEFRKMLPVREKRERPNRETLSPDLQIVGSTLVEKLSFSHFNELSSLDDQLKRAFYEMECIRGGWSVRELRRQIGSLYYERTGLSTNKEKLAEHVQNSADKADPRLVIRDPYVFEFLGLEAREVMGESELEDSLLDKVQEFLLELGHGFCFEARQKRILIGDTLGFIDLVFYHRVLKCHVLIELKAARFTHEHLGQLNTYVNWYRRNVMTEGDNPPVGLLLCTQKDHALVEYALAGMDNSLFVSKYQLELPKKEDIQHFIEQQFRKAAHEK